MIRICKNGSSPLNKKQSNYYEIVVRSNTPQPPAQRGCRLYQQSKRCAGLAADGGLGLE
jgi:hypothetical protein